MYYRTRTYIAADWSGDYDAVEQLHKWNSSKYWSLSFTDAHDLMQARDMNLCVLAKKCGISYSTIQTTARRGGQLSVETIERICLGLGITLKDFFDSSYL